MNLPDPAAAAPVAAADPVLVVPAVHAVPVVPANPVGPNVPVRSTQSIFQQCVNEFNWVFFLLRFAARNRSEVPMKTFWKNHIIISLFLLAKHLLVSSAVMSSPQDLIGASAASVLSLLPGCGTFCRRR